MRIDHDGMLDACEYVPSPNFDERPQCDIELVVIHNISLPPGEFGGDAIGRFFSNALDPLQHPYFETLIGLKVSAHFLIRRDGKVIQFVPCSMRAWHAGLSTWQGRHGCNDFSLGVELEGTDDVPFTEAQYVSLQKLTFALRARYPICAVAGHSNIAPLRKTDPGPYFDWARYLVSICSPIDVPA